MNRQGIIDRAAHAVFGEVLSKGISFAIWHPNCVLVKNVVVITSSPGPIL